MIAKIFNRLKKINFLNYGYKKNQINGEILEENLILTQRWFKKN